jgi:lipoprotein-anchoring transpeptidase ErfK/SrfK
MRDQLIAAAVVGRRTLCSCRVPQRSQDPRYRYDVPVEYAQRLTWQGEYVHAASWSEPSQGMVNVSHGCVNTLLRDAELLPVVG